MIIVKRKLTLKYQFYRRGGGGSGFLHGAICIGSRDGPGCAIWDDGYHAADRGVRERRDHHDSGHDDRVYSDRQQHVGQSE